jgi:aminotransferase
VQWPPREVLLEIASIAEEHDLIVISDEIYDRLVYDFEHVCVPALEKDTRRRTVLLGGFSKDYAMTGWRIGYASRPGRHHQGHGAHPPVQRHVRADHCAGCRHRSVLKSGENTYVQEMVTEYDRRRRLHGDWTKSPRSLENLRAAGRVLCVPATYSLRHGR